MRIISLARSDIAKRLPNQLLTTLFYRLNNVMLQLPPLRERGPDLVPLVRAILEQLTPRGRTIPTIEPSAWTALSTYPFPGNLDELASVLAQAMARAGTDPIHRHHLPAAVLGGT